MMFIMPFRRTRSPLFSLILWGACLTAWLVFGNSPASAETGNFHQLPMAPDKPDHGLILSIDSRWIDGSGYRPIRVTVGTANGRPAPADRRVKVTLQPLEYNMSAALPAVTKEIELPQGKAIATEIILVPQQTIWYGMSVGVTEDGRKLSELSNPHLTSFMSSYNYTMTEAYPATIVFHRNAPDRSQRSSWVLDQANKLDSGEEVVAFPDLRILFNEQALPGSTPLKSHFTGSPYQAISALSYLTRSDVLPLNEIPDDWLGLSSADLLVFELEDLQSLQNTAPEKLIAVRDWVLAGGNLLVWNAGDEGPRKIDPLFSKTHQAGENAWEEYTIDAYQTHDLGVLRTLRHPRSSYGINAATDYSALAIQDGKLVETGNRNNGNAPTAEKPLNFVARELGYGKILLVKEDPFPGNMTTWERMFGAFGGGRLAWFERHGMSRVRENLGFWDFLVPGVGVAPVTTFEVLITLFVIVIGPVNYFVLRAMSRLNLLIITVPAGAFLITALLMLYAVLSDGFSTQTRIRSVTRLDQQSGLGSSWSRQAYYSGLASSAGLSFPTDTAIYEYEQFPTTENFGQKKIAWDKQQILSGGYFRSRVTQQFLVVRPYETERHLEIDTSGDGISVTNKLGTKIEALLVVDDAGKPHFTSNLNADASSKLQLEHPDAANRIRAMINEAGLGVPVGFDRHMYRRMNQRRYYARYINMPEQHQADPNFSHALMERQLQDQLVKAFQAFGPRSYVAIVERFPETPIGIDAPLGEKSLEVIQATW